MVYQTLKLQKKSKLNVDISHKAADITLHLKKLFLENTIRFLRKVHNLFQNSLRSLCEDVLHQGMHVLEINDLLLMYRTEPDTNDLSGARKARQFRKIPCTV